MTEKDHINRQSKQKLNETRVSSNFLDNSYQGSIILNNNISNQNIIPLHSHYIYKNINPNHNVKSISNLENSFSPPFRLLNTNSEAPKSNSQSQPSLIGLRRKKGFGSSQERRLPIFQGLKVLQYNVKPGEKCIINNLGIKTHNKINEPFESENMNKTTKIDIDQRKYPEKKFGFGSGQKLERIQQRIYKRGCPGPGQYQINETSIGNTIKYKRLAHQILNMKNKQNSQEKKIIQVEPSHYYDKQFHDREQSVLKWRRKQKINEKKTKIKSLLSKMNFRLNQTKLMYQKQKFEKCSQKINRYSQNRFEYISKKNQLNKNSNNLDKKIPYRSNQLIRNQLREKTNHFLPKVDDIILPFQQSQFRQPSYKYMFSNSFVSKNDHAFQAHFYKPKQKQGQFIFLKAKKQFKKTEELSPFFKSKSTRIAF